LITANILTEANVVLLEEIMIIQCSAVFEVMCPSTNATMLHASNIWVLKDGMRSPMVHVESQKFIGSFFTITNIDLQEVDKSLIMIHEWLRSVIA